MSNSIDAAARLFSQPSQQQSASHHVTILPESIKSDVEQQLVSTLAENVLGETTKRAQGFFNLYANIDYVRPYFDVDTKAVVNRLIQSLVPMKKTWVLDEVMDLYTPSMLALTLVAILIYRMKLGSVHLNEGTIMGTSFGLCFTYWTVVSLLAYFMGYIFDFQKLGVFQSFSIIGYGLTGYCVPLALEFFISSEEIVYLIFLAFGALSAITVLVTFTQYAATKHNGLIVGGTAAFFHFTFLFYLKIAYGAS